LYDVRNKGRVAKVLQLLKLSEDPAVRKHPPSTEAAVWQAYWREKDEIGVVFI
jgi:hypothetical protein